MNREQKTAVVEELAAEIRGAEAVFAVDYRGISVTQAADLRSRLRDADARFRVVKNSLTERAADQAGAEALRPFLAGPTALTFVQGDAALAAKALSDVARATQLLDFKGGTLNGGALTGDDIRAIARLPTRDVLYGQLVGVVASPVTGLARTLNALLAGVAVALGQIREQGKLEGNAAPEPEAPAAEAPAPEAGAAPSEEAEAPAAEAQAAPPAEAPAPDLEAAPPEEAEAPAPEADTAPAAEPEAAPTESETVTTEEDQ
jgi:large subunit ribosomal protein L10